MKTRFRHLLLALAALLLPLSSFADTQVVDGITWTYTVSNGEVSLGSGYYYGERAVSTSTTGAITIPSSFDNCPVTSIGISAFRGCSGLTSIAIPDSVTSIGDYAFYGCSGLTSVTIPSSVTSIGNYAFFGCSGLTSLTIPAGVTSIGNQAFSGCSGLTSITIPEGVASIGMSAFDNCSGLTSVTIPSSVTSIGNYAFFGCSGLTSITIPEGVASIGVSAFNNCSGLTSVTIPSSVTSIGNYAFFGCSGIKDVVLPGRFRMSTIFPEYYNSTTNAIVSRGSSTVGDSTFADCSGLTSITIPDSVTSIGSNAFCGCSGLTSITIPDSVTNIGSYAFSGCSGLTSITIPDSVTSIGQSAFSGCPDTLFDTNGIRGLKLVDGWVVGYTDSLSGNLDLAGVRGIAGSAFFGCTGLTSITIPDGVTSIGSDTFSGCSGLTSVTIPDGVTSIGSNAFSGCSGLTSITIPDSVTSIGSNAFSGCSGLTSITIPDGVTSIGSNAFSGCSGLTSIKVEVNNPNYSSLNGLLLSKDETSLIRGVNGNVTIPDSVTSIGDYAFYGCSGLTSVTIPSSVTSIGNYAFFGCSGLTSLTIPAGVTSIGSSAFSGCSGLTSLTIPDGVTSIGNYAFDGCSGLTSVTADPKWGWMFSSATNYVFTIPDGVTNIRRSAFFRCSGLTSVTIPHSVTSIGDEAFFCCSGLTSVAIPDSVTSIGQSAFEDCSGLTSITIPDSVTSIGGGAFSGCSGLTSITIPSGVTSIGADAFYRCSGLTSITIPSGVTSIGGHAFYGCSGLTSITIPDSVMSIGGSAFLNCSGLTSITIPDSVTSIGDHAFDGCSELASVLIGDGLTSIGEQAFRRCYGLRSITISENNSVFDSRDNCNAIIRTSDNTLVTGCSGTIIPDSVTSIGANAFAGCKELTSIQFPNSITNIGASAFDHCTGLKTVIVPESVTSVGDAAFAECNQAIVYLPVEYSGDTSRWGISSDRIVHYIQISFDFFPGTLQGESNRNYILTNNLYGGNFASGHLPSASRFGYSFQGWDLYGSPILDNSAVQETTNHVLTATWTPNEYMVSFDANGGNTVADEKRITFDSTYGDLPTPTRTGYGFSGWTLYGNAVTATTICTTASNHVLFAAWTPNKYIVSFDANGGNAVGVEKTIAYDSAYGELPTPTRTGYGFSGWTLNGNVVSAATICTTVANHTLVATWTPNEYTISFDANGGNAVSGEKTVVFDSAYGELPTPTRSGYVFSGWNLHGNAVTATTICTTASNHVLKASWTLDEYSVSFDTAGGNQLDSIVVVFHAEYGELPTPTRPGYSFLGWVLDGVPITATSICNAVSDHVLTATWSPNGTEVFFQANGGSGIMPNIVLEAEEILPQCTFTKSGHFFLGWALSQDGEAVLLDGDSTVEIEAEAGETVTLYAVWHKGTKKDAYAVRFDANGGHFAKRKGLTAKYYDIGSISDSSWYQQVDTYDECIAYHAAMTPTIVTNTADIGETLDFGDNNNSSTAFFHGKYRQYGTENFVLLLEGTFDCAENGTYSFKARHDDGCVVYIDGTPAYRRSYATSGWYSFSVSLNTGEHEFVVAMHEGGGGQSLQFQMKGPSDGTYAGLPQSLLSRSEDLPVKDGATSFKRVYARGDDIELPAVARDGYTLAGWGPEAGGSALYPATGTLAGGIAANDGETAELHAVWTANEYDVEFDANGGNEILQSKRGLALKYYDISSSDYSTWSASETALTNYFAAYTPTIVANTLAFGETLDPGIAGVDQSSINQFRNWGLNDLRFEADGPTNRFHGKYANKNQENIAALLTGTINTETGGTYSFACIADDYEAIFIDGVRVCRSSWNSVGSGSIELSIGPHSFAMGFHEGDGGHGFAVEWKKPGDTVWSPLPQSVLFEDYPILETATFDSAYGPLPETSRTGYTFAGWMLDDETVTAKTICTTPSNHVLTAAWTPNEYTVSFDATGGTVDPASKGITFDAAYGALPTPVREPYVFVDWRLAGASVDAETVVTTPSNHVLSARWGVSIGGGVWEETICDELISLGAPLVAPSGEVVVPSEIDGRPVVEIGADAFAGNASITSITIPASVTNIADGAFAGCTGLKTVAVDSLRDDHFAAFLPDLAETVERVVFLDGVTAIPDNFFEGCTALWTMDIADSVADIGTNVFEACSALTTTVLENGLEMYQGWVLGFAGGSLGELAPPDLAIPAEYEEADGSGSRPYQVRGIAAGAFEGEWGIGTMSLPESLRFVGVRAFKDCTSLESLAVPEGVVKIDREAFRNCTYAQGLALPGTLREIGDGAFANASMLMGATLPDGVASVGECAFSNCWRMLSVAIPQSVERVGDGAFADCRRVVGVTVPLHVRPMSELFPAAYASLETISISRLDLEALEHLEGLESENAIQAYIASRQMVPEVFKGCAALEGIELPAWVRNVSDGALEGCASISSLELPDAVTNVGARACAGMAALESVALPASLVSIGDEAFDGDAGLAALHLPEGLRTIGERAFRGLVPLARAEIPGSVRAIGDGAFAGCASIRAVSMPGDAGTAAAVFPDCYADIVSATVVAEDGSPGELAPPKLTAGLFEGCAALTSVELPAELAEIGAEAFADCTSLAEIGLPAAVTNLGERAFAGCGTLSSIALPKSLEELRDGTFAGCASIAEIVVPESVRRFGNGIFSGCTLLRSVRFVGNAPDYGTADGGPYAGVPAGAKSYVANGSKGWDGIATSMALPEYWPADTTYEIAFWTPNRCAVSFDANYEGAGEPAEVEQVTGTSYVLPPNPVRLGARFDGWWTAPENGARITASTQVTATRPHTFYAHWTMNRYYVHFDASGGSGTADPLEMTVGTPAALPPCPFAKVAHDFAGWATEPGGEVVYADGAQVADLAYAQNAAVTLYAVWRSRDWTLADYLDAPALSFGTAGGGAWGPDWNDAKAGGVSLRCDGLPPAAGGGTVEATLRATVVGAGTLSFWWKTSCEEMDEEYGDWFDYAAFSVDGAETAKIAGESGWRKVECAVEGAGEHGLVWAFVRDDYDEDGADWENALWVDGVEWIPAPVTLSFDAGGATEGAPPASVVKYEGYALALPGPGTLADPPRVFAGWSDGESVYAAGATYVFGSADAVLTAVWTLQTWTLAEAVDAPALVFATGGDADWAVDATAGWTNGVSAKSGSVTNSQASWIETTVSGAGTLSFRWKVLGGIYRNTPFAYAKAEVDGTPASSTHLTDGWEAQALDIVGVGPHTIRWTYLRTSARDCDGDCAWLDGVAWTPAGAPDIVVEGVSIPIAWLDEAAASIVAANGGDFAAAARATAANGANAVWQCYVAGLDPTNVTSRLLATIEMENGEPVVTWTPDLNEGGTKSERVYTVEGKASLVDESWGPTNEATRFFRVKVEMP